MSTPPKRVTTAKELAELTRQIRNVQKRCKRAEAKAASLPPKARGHTQTTLRCQAGSNLCMMVYVLAGLRTKVAVDFSWALDGAEKVLARTQKSQRLWKVRLRMPFYQHHCLHWWR